MHICTRTRNLPSFVLIRTFLHRLQPHDLRALPWNNFLSLFSTRFFCLSRPARSVPFLSHCIGPSEQYYQSKYHTNTIALLPVTSTLLRARSLSLSYLAIIHFTLWESAYPHFVPPIAGYSRISGGYLCPRLSLSRQCVSSAICA